MLPIYETTSYGCKLTVVRKITITRFLEREASTYDQTQQIYPA